MFRFNPSFPGVNRLFLLSFENNAYRISHKRYFIPIAEIKDYNVMIVGRHFCEKIVKNDIKNIKALKKSYWTRSYYTIGYLQDYSYIKKK